MELKKERQKHPFNLPLNCMVLCLDHMQRPFQWTWKCKYAIENSFGLVFEACLPVLLVGPKQKNGTRNRKLCQYYIKSSHYLCFLLFVYNVPTVFSAPLYVFTPQLVKYDKNI